MDFFPIKIKGLWIQKRDNARIKRLNNLGLSNSEILRAGIKAWEDRKKLKPINFRIY
jgi:hypothetical protein